MRRARTLLAEKLARKLKSRGCGCGHPSPALVERTGLRPTVPF